MSVIDALFDAVSESISDARNEAVPTDRVRELLENRHAVPSDYFWSVFDDEVSVLIDRFEQAEREETNQ